MTDAPLPLFPLSDVVLFPGVQIPLHVFEMRYRQLARDALAAERRIGMVAVRPDHVSEMPGDPPLFPVGCRGTISQSRTRPDGHYDLVLRGERRFRIDRELPRSGTRLYRSARITLLEDSYPQSTRQRVASCRGEILASVAHTFSHEREGNATASPADYLKSLDDESFVNTLANAFRFPVEEKQMLLETNDISQRFELLAGALECWLQGADEAPSPGRRTLH